VLRRIFYALRMAWQYRPILAAIRRQTPPDQTTTMLIPAQLRHHGVQVLILDFDGVLAAHGESHPHPDIIPWLDACVSAFGASHIFVLSNKPLPARLNYFARHYPGLRCITGTAKKPYPDGLYAIQQLSGLPPAAHALVDDRLLTGALAASIAGCRAIYITHPLANFRKRPLQETFFYLIRRAERFF
jgi:uncharacterized protein